MHDVLVSAVHQQDTAAKNWPTKVKKNWGSIRWFDFTAMQNSVNDYEHVGILLLKFFF